MAVMVSVALFHSQNVPPTPILVLLYHQERGMFLGDDSPFEYLSWHLDPELSSQSARHSFSQEELPEEGLA